MKLENYYIKDDASTDENYGCYPTKRPIEEYIRKGLVCIDKPMGPSSHEVVVWVRKILNVSKTGHAGTLDPRVTGVLPIFIENATKMVKFLQESSKEYVCLMRLHGDAKREDVERVMKKFVGRIYQRPPLKSAVKKVLRIREIYEIELLEMEGRDILFRVVTESGTYIRKLCRDIGEILGTGAHMQELRRTRTGRFGEDMCYTLQDLLDAYIFWKEEGEEKYLREIIKPMEVAAADLPKIVIKDSAVDAICHGANLSVRGVAYVEKNVRKDSTVAIFTLKNELVAIGRALMDAEDIYRLKKGVAADIQRVLMERGVYPRVWKSSVKS
ncbi:MAG: RNA-guided pseudouridylation complex pseudouridine synthase subunit Cbf5 [Archaeoglobus sp.]|uniref:RNA-guided pseudouridylation complex pseudouridine synthase subunit Cbf5 n=1 Tax=Archaeoglobus sp. TaxID=1872626 RepID=UPI001E17E6D1|nr:RNA-guided pseudouridylation complex pseudouridine synthase subunit Cbf5 [Archaeoglobus sp.]MBO8179786.1 RNA-guided pseudouridylation complex pseudouridine synthase subunit Cbf5 [Archaeoglobus sp.]